MVDKKCSKCRNTGQLFGVDRRRKDGLTPWCKECQKEYRISSTEHRLAQKKDYYQKNKKKRLEKNREWLLKNRDVANRYKRVYYKELFKNNPELQRTYYAARRARVIGAGGRFTSGEVKGLFSSQKGKCVYCRVELGSEYEADHIMPLALGGSNYIENIQLLCKPCNRRKHAKHPDVFASEIGWLF